MHMHWRPVVHSATCVEIPVVVATHSRRAYERWKEAQEPWRYSGYTDDSAFGRYARLAKTERFRFPKGGQAPYKFGEFHAGLLLDRAGFTCWTGVQLFDHRKPKRGFWLKNTNEVRRKWPRAWDWPGDIQRTLAFLPRTPDLVAYHPRKGWRFCEVKRLNDRIKDDQLRALAVLHLLTGAPVAIVRVVPKGDRTDWKPREASLTYLNGVRPSWIRRTKALFR